jgi:parvulin-like peptidyl-prolyl isomerase
VIYLEEKNDAKPVSYDSVKEKIIATLKQQEFAKKIAEIANELKSKAKIVDPSKEVNTTTK